MRPVDTKNCPWLPLPQTASASLSRYHANQGGQCQSTQNSRYCWSIEDFKQRHVPPPRSRNRTIDQCVGAED